MAFIVGQTGGDTFACSGTVVAPNLVLTAGHCAQDTDSGVTRSPDVYTVITGRLDYSNAGAGQVSGVSRVIVSPTFNRVRLSGDAAILVLSTPTTAPAISLANASDLYLLNGGTNALIAGWGQTDPSGDLPTELQVASTVIQRPTYCSHFFGAQFTTSEACAINPSAFATGTCHGDSGGPLIARRADGTWAQVGITSYGDTFCDTSTPSVFTRTDWASGWINAWIAALRPAIAATPSPTPPPAPVPKVTVNTSPLATAYLSVASAKTYARTALRERMVTRFVHRHAFKESCWTDSRLQATCNVTWWRGRYDYWGRVTVFLTTDARQQLVWDDHVSIRAAMNACLIARPKRHCPTQTFTA